MLATPLIGGAATFSNFQTLCTNSHTNNDDPIVFPGQQGASHKHLFFANTSTDYASTYQSMVAAGTNCGEQGDTAGYWMPTVIVNGQERLPSPGARFWYSQPENCAAFCSNGQAMEVDHTFPADLRVIAGKSTATSAADNPLIASGNLRWNCYGAAGGQSLSGIPIECDDTPDGQRLDLWVRFPACWDGVNKDSADHRSHMAYPTSAGCPSSHPVVLPQLVGQVIWQEEFNGSDFDGYSSGAYYTAHFDFWNTWQQPRLVELTGGVDAPDQNQPPLASFTHSCVRRDCSFNGTGSTDSDGSIVSYAWDFGDGQQGSGSTALHSYAVNGSYIVTLTVTDDDGAIDTEAKTICVRC